jgi:hypothetical protein
MTSLLAPRAEASDVRHGNLALLEGMEAAVVGSIAIVRAPGACIVSAAGQSQRGEDRPDEQSSPHEHPPFHL